ncbi:hypothetical protein [Mycobacterium celatum]|uniref:hypothetical protein n=1 Tax=Mycobacterium celatum TaxID=28045 RepID=UPI000A9D17FA|nr:hypothetical protein [Mycobacterium celatum]
MLLEGNVVGHKAGAVTVIDIYRAETSRERSANNKRAKLLQWRSFQGITVAVLVVKITVVELGAGTCWPRPRYKGGLRGE